MKWTRENNPNEFTCGAASLSWNRDVRVDVIVREVFRQPLPTWEGLPVVKKDSLKISQIEKIRDLELTYLLTYFF